MRLPHSHSGLSATLHFSSQTEQQINSMKTSSWKKNSPWPQNLAPAHQPWFPSWDPSAQLCFNFFFGGGGEFSSLNKSGECRILSLMSISLFQPLTDSYPFFFSCIPLPTLNWNFISVEYFKLELRHQEISLGKAPLCLYTPILFIY